MQNKKMYLWKRLFLSKVFKNNKQKTTKQQQVAVATSEQTTATAAKQQYKQTNLWMDGHIYRQTS